MFTCRACTTRLLAAVVDHALVSRPTANALRPSVISASAPQTRGFALKRTKRDPEDELDGMPEAALDGDPGGEREPDKKMQRAVNHRLALMDDPYHIAKDVLLTLAKDRYDEAKFMVAKASGKKKNLTVSWNHLIDYQMRHQRLNGAIKLFNEMKKLFQVPNAHTYTIIFRGCAQSVHKKLAVAEAFKMYNNMLKSDRFKPNTTHLNALLEVCSRAGDIDTLFTVVKSANSTDRAPDAFTYTTILNALRAKVQFEPSRQPGGTSPARPTEKGREMEQATIQTIQRAKAIWEEVLAKWRSATLVIDEQLACAMGRILLMGSHADKMDVLSLVEQTMGIPKDEQALIKMAREAHLTPRGNDMPQSPPRLGLQGAPAAKHTKPASPAHARPGNNALGLVLTALQLMTKTSLVARYWDVFTRKFLVAPDARNWHLLLRSLRYGHNSGKVAEYLWIMPKDFMSAPTFRIAMNACLRDNLNKKAFHNACQVFEVMITSLRSPDAHVMRIYLQTAYAVKRPFEDPAAAKLAYGKQMVTALENLWEPYRMATKQFAFGGLTPRTPPLSVSSPGPLNPASAPAPVPAADADAAADATDTSVPKPTASEIALQMWKLHAVARGEICALARKMIAAYDRLIFGDLATADTVAKIKPRRNQINAFVVKYFEDREKYEPGWSFRQMQEEKRREENDGLGDEDDHEFMEGSSRKSPVDAW
ncbi:pentatricopeptide repeat protein [Apiospora kogelbergensis]|uniref:Pentatricopeptide repeat protein n=1 Tax=Apiospora kogelbergensis TaxID=1337665 RepID=A0AAW0QWP3_9PEZI